MSPPLAAHRPLPSGHVLDIYQFENVLGKAGAFGITYAVCDLRNGGKVAIDYLAAAGSAGCADFSRGVRSAG